eukprot:256736-Prorocentrum_minimum.AAC.1
MVRGWEAGPGRRGRRKGRLRVGGRDSEKLACRSEEREKRAGDDEQVDDLGGQVDDKGGQVDDKGRLRERGPAKRPKVERWSRAGRRLGPIATVWVERER